MSEAATSVATWSTEQWMVEMVHDRIATGETTVVSMAAVLWCGKQMEKLPHYNFSWTVSLQKNMWDASPGDKLKIALFGDLSLEEAMDLLRDRQILELEPNVASGTCLSSCCLGTCSSSRCLGIVFIKPLPQFMYVFVYKQPWCFLTFELRELINIWTGSAKKRKIYCH
jgi:hypothetical protein